MSYDNDRQVILSKVTSENPKAPPLRVKVELNGVQYEAGLWPWTKKDGTPVCDKNGAAKYIGKLELDDWEPEKKQSAEKITDFEDLPF